MSVSVDDRAEPSRSDMEKDWRLTEMLLDTAFPEIKDAVVAAAIPHWFDAAVMACLLNEPEAGQNNVYEQISVLPIAERFGDLGTALHERTRKAILYHLIKEKPQRLKEYNRRAYDYFAKYGDPERQAEACYHQMALDPAKAAGVLKNQVDNFINVQNYGAANTLLRDAEELINLNTLDYLVGKEIQAQRSRVDYAVKAKTETEKPTDMVDRALSRHSPDSGSLGAKIGPSGRLATVSRAARGPEASKTAV